MGMQELGQRLHDMTKNPGVLDTYNSTSCDTVPLIARVYLKLGTWNQALKPILDDEAVKGIFMK